MNENNNLKRSHLTERIGDAEGNRLPNKTKKNKDLASQVEEKRKLLEKLMVRVQNSSADLSAIEQSISGNELRKTQYGSSLTGNTVLRDQFIDELRTLEFENSLLKKDLHSFNDQTGKEEKAEQQFEQTLKDRMRRLEHLLTKDMVSDRNDITQGTADEEKDRHKKEETDRDVKKREEMRELLQKTIKQLQGEIELEKRILLNRMSELEEKKVDKQEQEHFLKELEEEIDEKEREWIAVQDKISHVEVGLAEAKSKDELELARQQTYKTKIDILELEPTPIYRSYESLAASSRDSTRSVNRGGSQRKETHLRRAAEKANKGIEELQSLQKELELSSDGETVNEMETRTKLLDLRASGDQLLRNFEKEKTIPKRVENDGIERRKKELVLQEALETMELCDQHRKAKYSMENILKEKAGDEQKVNQMEKQYETLLHQKNDFYKKIDQTKKKVEQLQQQNEAETTRIQEEKHNQEHLYAKELPELLSENEKMKVTMKEIWIGNQIVKERHKKDINSLNRYRLFIKKSCNEGNSNLDSSLMNWKDKVREYESEYNGLWELVKKARENNARVRQDLAVIKPYFSEQSEFEFLREQLRNLDRELQDKQVKQRLRKWQKTGDILFEE